MPDPHTGEDSLDHYWGSLVGDCTGDVDPPENKGGDIRLFALLDELNDARLLLRDDSTIRAGGSDTHCFVPVDPSIDIGTEIDGYRVTRMLGRGGMGIVFAADQIALGREVAIKLIRTGPLATEEDLSRFESEASATAGLNHPGIVSVIDSGQWQGHHFFSMQLVEGPTLHELFRDGPIETKRAARYIRQISEAIQHAHEHRVLHRDIKPSNVIVDVETDQPCVTDFGLAKLFEPDSESSTAYEWTKSGAMVGTPSYMSPEQALGQSKYVLPASDVYSIGAILYEALTGRAPFRAATAIETMRQVVDAEPAALRSLNPDVSRDLETICLKCLSKKPDARYQSAAELRDELDRYLAGNPILARPVGNFSRAWRWCVRNPAIAGSFAIVGALVLGGGAIHNLRLSREIANTKAAERRANDSLAHAVAAQKLAERDYDRADQAVNRMLYTLGAVDLEDLPQGGELRLELLSESASLQRQFVEDHPDDSGRVTKLIVAEQRLAEVMLTQGKMSEAKGVLNDAINRIETFTGERDTEFNEAELVTRNKLSNWFVVQGQNTKSIEILELLIARAQELNESDPENCSLWNSHLAIDSGNLAILSNDNEQKTKYAKQAIEAYEEMIEAGDTDFSNRLGLSGARSILAMATQHSDQQAALALYQTTMRELEQLLEEYPEKVLAKQRLGETNYNMGLLYKRMGQIDETRNAYLRSIAVRQEIAEDFPDRVLDISYLAATHSSVGHLYLADEDYEQALSCYGEATGILRQLLKKHPDCFPAKDYLFGPLLNQGISLLRLDRPVDAVASCEQAASVAAELGKRMYAVFDVPLVSIVCGEARCALGHRAKGLAEMQVGIDLAIENATREPSEETLDRLREYYVQFASGLGRHEFDMEAKSLIDQIASDAALGTSANHASAAACSIFCKHRFRDPKRADDTLSAWFGDRALSLLRDSDQAGYEPPLTYEKDPAFEAFRSLERFRDVAEFLEELESRNTLTESS